MQTQSSISEPEWRTALIGLLRQVAEVESHTGAIRFNGRIKQPPQNPESRELAIETTPQFFGEYCYAHVLSTARCQGIKRTGGKIRVDFTWWRSPACKWRSLFMSIFFPPPTIQFVLEIDDSGAAITHVQFDGDSARTYTFKRQPWLDPVERGIQEVTDHIRHNWTPLKAPGENPAQRSGCGEEEEDTRWKS